MIFLVSSNSYSADNFIYSDVLNSDLLLKVIASSDGLESLNNLIKKMRQVSKKTKNILSDKCNLELILCKYYNKPELLKLIKHNKNIHFMYCCTILVNIAYKFKYISIIDALDIIGFNKEIYLNLEEYLPYGTTLSEVVCNYINHILHILCEHKNKHRFLMAPIFIHTEEDFQNAIEKFFSQIDDISTDLIFYILFLRKIGCKISCIDQKSQIEHLDNINKKFDGFALNQYKDKAIEIYNLIINVSQ